MPTKFQQSLTMRFQTWYC